MYKTTREKLIEFVKLKNKLILKLQKNYKNKIMYCNEEVLKSIETWPIERCEYVYILLKHYIMIKKEDGLLSTSCVWCLEKERDGLLCDGLLCECDFCKYGEYYGICWKQYSNFQKMLKRKIKNKIKNSHYVTILNKIEEKEIKEKRKKKVDKI